MITMPITIKMILIVLYGANSSIIMKAKPKANIIVPRNVSHFLIGLLIICITSLLKKGFLFNEIIGFVYIIT